MTSADDGFDFPELVQWLGHYVVSVDLKTKRLLYASPGAAQRMGQPGAVVELRDATLEHFLTTFFLDMGPRERIRTLLDGDMGPDASFEYRSPTPSTPRWRRAVFRVLSDDEGSPMRLDIVSSDVTELVESRRATARSETLRRIGERVHGAARLGEVIDIICTEVRQTLDVARCALFMFDNNTGVTSVAGTSRAPGLLAQPPWWTREQLRVAHEKYGRVAQFADVRDFPDLPQHDYLLDAGIRSLATVAIGTGAQPLGVLVASTVETERRFDADEMRLLEDVANVVAGPLARAALDEEKARAAARVEAAEERARAALEATQTGIWAFDPATLTLAWDARCYEIWEMDPASPASGEAVNECIHPDDRALVGAAFAAALDPDGEGRFSIEYRYLGPSRVPRWLEVHGQCFFGVDRRPRRYIGTVVDVTTRRRDQLERLASERRYREIVETMTEGVGVLDERGHLRFANRAFAQIFGYQTEAEVVGSDIEELTFPEDRARERAAWTEHVAAGGRGMRRLRRFRARDGRELTISAAAVPIFDEGIVTGIVCVLTDVTAARQLEDKLQQAQKLESLGVLAGGIAHDFNNLLVGMLGNAGLARAELSPESSAYASIASIETAALRASELTRQLLAYAGKGRFVVAPIDLRQLVEEMGHLLGTVIGKSVTLAYRFGAGMPAIEGDATQLRQVVMNLITNASDAIGDNTGTVVLTTSVVALDASHRSQALLDDALPAGNYVCLEVTDTGAGMSGETRARVFDPFFTTKFTGRGLGLAAVLGIVRAHHGGISVTSELGRGTTFKLFLPATTAQPEIVTGTPAPVAPPAARGTVLVVDDEEIVRKVMVRALKRAGFDVLTAHDGVEGLATFRGRHDIRAVVLDQTMPRMGGEETYQHLRELDPDVQVLLASGYSEQEMTSQFARVGIAAFLEKPFSPEALVERVHALVSAREALAPRIA